MLAYSRWVSLLIPQRETGQVGALSTSLFTSAFNSPFAKPVDLYSIMAAQSPINYTV